MTFPPIKLPDDLQAALAKIADYLRTRHKGQPSHEVRDPVCGEVYGYWQTTEWLDGLDEIASECDRLAALSRTEFGEGFTDGYNEGHADGTNTGIYKGDLALACAQEQRAAKKGGQ